MTTKLKQEIDNRLELYEARAITRENCLQLIIDLVDASFANAVIEGTSMGELFKDFNLKIISDLE